MRDMNKKLYRKSWEKAFAVLTLAAGAVCGYSQGQVSWSDYLLNDFQITIWSPNYFSWEDQLEGNSPTNFGTGLIPTGPDIPSGVQTGYTGVPLGGSATGKVGVAEYANGNLWSVQLYAADGKDVPAHLLKPVPGAVANMWTDADNEGLYDVTGNAIVAIPGVPPGSVATLQLRVWYNDAGLITNYEAAVGAWLPSGQSTTGSETLGGKFPYIAPPDLPSPAGIQLGNTAWVSGGITSFNVCEPPLTPVSQPAQIRWITISQGVVQFEFEGAYGQDYSLQVSADLLHWTNLADFPLTCGIGQYSVAISQDSPQFFRLFSPQ
jgi:hypothetical protein